MSKRGSLRVYLGMAPGVGKTFAMLDEGRRRQERGAKVLAGIIETHGRAHTEEKLAGLPMVPRKKLAYQGSEFLEMDLQEILERNPDIALIDELAHTNIPGSVNEKRWQDIDALLDAGIDVISTVNIQHLESLNDVVQKITGVEQRETVPDAFLRQADQVEIVDISPEALQRRMVHGNIYAAEKIDAALSNYFRKGNLAALRELALLWVADKVEEGLQDYRKSEGIQDIWEAQERIVVAVNDSLEGETIIKRASRIADRTPGAKLFTLHVLNSDGVSSTDVARLTQFETLTESMRGSFHQIASESIPEAIIDFARSVNATQVVLGVTSKGRWKRLLQGEAISSKVTRLSEDIDVHLVTHEQAARVKRRRFQGAGGLDKGRRIQAVLLLAALFPLLTFVLSLYRGSLNTFTDGLIFLIANTFIAILGGFVPSVLAALVSTALLNFYFIPPIHTFTIAEKNNVIALLVFLFDAVIISSLVEQSAKRTRQALVASKESSVLSALAGKVLRGDSGIAGLIENARKVLSFTSLSLVYKPSSGPEGSKGIQNAIENRVEDQSANSIHFEWSVNQSLTLVGSGRTLQPQDSRVLEALSAQLELMWEREILSDQAKHASELAEADRMRSALLSAVSHDLRGPLASALASVSSLRNESIHWSGEQRRGLLETAENSLERLNRLIDNLLDMSRLQAGALAVHFEYVSFQDLLPQTFSSIPITSAEANLSLAPDLPEIRTDSGLLERALANLISNALTHGTSVERPSVTVSRHGKSVQVRIIDHGRGIDLSDVTKVFTPFKRLGDSNNREGVGLGLALSKGLIEAIGGNLTLEETPGGGLTVVVSLPIAHDEAKN